MPMTIFDWIVRTAMLVMAGLVTLSILGAIATMTSDPGTGFAVPGDRPLIEGEPAEEREAAQAPRAPPGSEQGNGSAAMSGAGQGSTMVAAGSTSEDKVARWLEAIAYALLALAGIGALAILMLWRVVHELRRIGAAPRNP